MEKEKKYNKIITILILLIIISMTIFAQYITYDKRFYKNGFKYNKSGAFANTREIIVKPDASEKDIKFIVDADGNILRKAPFNLMQQYGIEDKDGKLEFMDHEFAVDDEYKTLKRITKKAKVNPEEVLNEDNYKKSQEILLNKFRKLGITDYNVSKDSKTGEMLLKLSDNSEYEAKKIEQLKRAINTEGLFQIMDAKTGKVYIDNGHIKSVINHIDPKAGLLMAINLNDEGTKILEEISKKYITRPATEEEKAEYNKKNKGKEVPPLEEKSAILYICIDGFPVLPVAFPEPLKTGQIHIPLIPNIASMNSNQIAEAKIEAEELANMIRVGAPPVKYAIYSETNLAPKMDQHNIQILMYSALAILILALIVFTIMYKQGGIIAWILSLAYIFLIIIIYQYTSIAITLPSIIAILTLYMLQFTFGIYVLSDMKKTGEANISQNIFKILKNTIILSVVGIVLCFSKETGLNSFGQMMVMGLIFFIIHNTIFAKNALEDTVKIGKEETKKK